MGKPVVPLEYGNVAKVLARIHIRRRRRCRSAQQVGVADGVAGTLAQYNKPHARPDRGPDLVEAFRDRHDDAGAGIGELRGDLVRRVGGVQRRTRRAGPRRAEEDHGILRQVRELDRHHVALLDPELPQRSREAVDLRAKIAVREPTTAHGIDDGGPFGVRVHTAEDELRELPVGNGRLQEPTTKDHGQRSWTARRAAVRPSHHPVRQVKASANNG